MLVTPYQTILRVLPIRAKFSCIEMTINASPILILFQHSFIVILTQCDEALRVSDMLRNFNRPMQQNDMNHN